MTTKQQKTYEPIPDLDGEVWKDVVGFEGLYQVSNKGRVKSLRNNIILKPYAQKNGYYVVVLCVNAKHKTVSIHHLVYDAFIGERPRGSVRGDSKKCMVINHKDENRLNNCVENLEVISHYDNILYGTSKQRQIEKLSIPLYQYSLDGNLIKKWSNSKECDKNGFDDSCVSRCYNGNYGGTQDRQVYKGFIWSKVKLSKEQCAKIASQPCNRRKHGVQRNIYQYDLNGSLVKVWKNAAECRKSGFSEPNIISCCYNKSKSYKGFIWQFEQLNKQKSEHFIKEVHDWLNKHTKKSVYQYTLSKKLVHIWKSQGECKRNGFDQSRISACCLGKRKSYNGYIWSFTPLFNND